MSLVIVKHFTVNDGSGGINVVTERPLPQKGQRIRVTGKVNELFSLGTETLLVLIEEPREAKPNTERTGDAMRRK
ncbi:MAG: hypothetical protein HYY28_14245 [Betaproteobacteria bacterium]|nr:hypothetical protein [Betaproteobacteria bacterium]MBI2961469.1 hypothetical protein [Betaproteobacteria bacterium]